MGGSSGVTTQPVFIPKQLRGTVLQMPAQTVRCPVPGAPLPPALVDRAAAALRADGLVILGDAIPLDVHAALASKMTADMLTLSVNDGDLDFVSCGSNSASHKIMLNNLIAPSPTATSGEAFSPLSGNFPTLPGYDGQSVEPNSLDLGDYNDDGVGNFIKRRLDFH